MPEAPFWAHGAGIEAALLPDHASEKFYGEAILRRSLFQRPANVVGRGRIRSRALRFGWHGLLIDLWMPGRRRGRAHLSARFGTYQGESTGKQRSGRSCHSHLTYELTYNAATFREGPDRSSARAWRVTGQGKLP